MNVVVQTRQNFQELAKHVDVDGFKDTEGFEVINMEGRTEEDFQPGVGPMHAWQRPRHRWLHQQVWTHIMVII